MKKQLATANGQTAITGAEPNFLTLVDMVGRTVSERSARAYAGDLAAWGAWADANGYDATMPSFGSVSAYIEDLAAQDASRAVIKRRASAIRKLAQMAAVLDFDNAKRRAAWESLALLRVKAGQKTKRDKVALTPAQATRAIEAWDGDTAIEQRNRAMVALALATGLRRSELVALRWADLDLDAGTVHVVAGKGDKERTSPIAGTVAIEALRTWAATQGGGREYVFCPVKRGGHVGADEPMPDQVVYRVCRETGERTDETFKPHDMRRTFITEAIETGTPVPTVSAIVGHQRKETTYLYAQANEAAMQRENLRLRYG